MRDVGVCREQTPSLTNREIIFEEFEPLWSRYLNVTDRQTERQTDGQLAVAIPRSAQHRAVKAHDGSFTVKHTSMILC